MIGIVHAVQNDNIVLEPWSYSQDFETGELSAWASYPIWQDAAYDEKIRVNTMVPGDNNISLEQKVIPYVHQFDFRPKAIIEKLDLLRPIYRSTTNYGHFGRPGFPWEE